MYLQVYPRSDTNIEKNYFNIPSNNQVHNKLHFIRYDLNDTQIKYSTSSLPELETECTVILLSFSLSFSNDFSLVSTLNPVNGLQTTYSFLYETDKLSCFRIVHTRILWFPLFVGNFKGDNHNLS